MKKIILMAWSITALLTSCNSELQLQKKWIYERIPDKVWCQTTYDSLENDYKQLCEAMTRYESDAIAKFEDEGDLEDLGALYVAQLFGLEDLYLLSGASNNQGKIREKVIAKYKEHCSTVIRNLNIDFGRCLALRDSSIGAQDDYSYYYLCERLLGVPDSIQKISREEQYEMILTNASAIIQEIKHPTISHCDYNKEKKLWTVRMDNTNNQYVVFHERDDKEYDVTFGSKLDANGEPKASEQIRVTLKEKAIPANAVDKVRSNKKFVPCKKPTIEMSYGLWKTDIIDDDIQELYITKDYVQRWYDANKVAEKNGIEYAGLYNGKTIYEVDRELWELSKEGIYQICDDEYSYGEYLMDESKTFMVDKYDPKRRYYKIL